MSCRFKQYKREEVAMKHLIVCAVIALLSAMIPLQVQEADAQDNAPLVFQAAGPTVESIQGTVDQFRAALGDPNNLNVAGPLTSGRREINWDGAAVPPTTATAPAPTPFEGFLVTRGARFSTLGTGFVQATPQGLADTFTNETYKDIFQPFSLERLFSPVGSNFTEVQFFVPGGGNIPARVTGFGAVFADVDDPNGSRRANARNRPSTLVEYFGANGRLLFSNSVPSSPGDATLSFFGIVFDEPRIARVRITTGDVAPGPDDEGRRDIVVMDDLIFGEPQ
jgi:hypothetical protein